MKKFVTDVWYPWRIGKVVKTTTTSVYVKWSDGEKQRYDKSHRNFLRTAQ